MTASTPDLDAVATTADPTGDPATATTATAAESARWRRPDLYAAMVYLAGAAWVTGRAWRGVGDRVLGSKPNDQSFCEWMLAHSAHAVTHLDNPFFTTLQNAPDGINLMTNVGMQLLGIVVTPLTLFGGPPLSYLVLMTANLVGTAFAWYWVLSRHVVGSRAAAFVGGLFCGFAPAMVSHSNGHLQITAQWLAPFIVWRIVRLTEPGRAVRNGLVLGGLVAVQFFVGLEILFLLALGAAIASIGYVIFRPRAALRAAPTVLAGLGIAGALVLAVTAYPLWMLFFGPQHRSGHPGDPDVYALRLPSFFAYATESIGGSATSTKGLTPNTTEEASFYGWPLIVLAVAATIWLRREFAVRILAFTAVVSALLAVGTTLSWGTWRLPGPFILIEHLPIVDTMVVGRFALITTAALGVLLAIATDRVIALGPQARSAGVPLRLIGGAGLLAALVPLLPTPLPAAGRPDVPTYVTSGRWRDHVAEGRTLVPVPVNGNTSVWWGAAALTGFAVPEGYFLGPTSPTDDTGRWGVTPRPTAVLLKAVAAGEREPVVTDAERAQAIADVRYWKADAVVLPGHRREAELRAVLDAFYGPALRVDDVWVWDVRRYTS